MNRLNYTLLIVVIFLFYRINKGFSFEWEPIPDSEWQLTADLQQNIKDAAILLSKGYYKTITEKNKPRRYRYEYYTRIKIFNEIGKTAGEQKIYYNPDIEEIIEIKGRIHKPDHSIIELTEKDIFIETLYQKGEEKLILKKVIFPGIEGNSIIEFFFSKTTNYISRNWTFQNDYYTFKSQFILEPGEVLFDWRFLNGFGTFPEIEFFPNREKMEKIIFTLTNIPPLPQEKMMPPHNDLKTSLYILYKSNFFYYFFLDENYYFVEFEIFKEGLTSMRLSNFTFWSNESKSYGLYINKYYEKSKFFDKLIKQIIFDSDNKITKIKKLYNHVQNNYTNESYLPEERRNKKYEVSNNVDEIIKTKHGNTWTVNALYVTLLQKAGLSATMIYLNDRDKTIFNPLILNSNFERFLVVVDTSDQKYIFLSPAIPFLEFGQIPWYSQKMVGLVGNNAQDKRPIFTKPLLEVKQDLSSSCNTQSSEALIEIHSDQSATVQITVALTGQANWLFKLENRNKNDEAILKEHQKKAEDRWINPEISDFKVSHRDSTSQTVKIYYVITIKNFANKIGKRLLIKPYVFDMALEKLTQSEKRLYPVMFNYIFKNFRKINIILPENYQLESIPAPQTVKTPVGSYQSQSKVNNNLIEFSEIFSIDELIVPAKFFSNIQTLAERVNQAYNQEIFLIPAQNEN